MPHVDVKEMARAAFLEALNASFLPLLRDTPEVRRRMDAMAVDYSFFTERELAGDPNAKEDLEWLLEAGESLGQRYALKAQTAKGKFFEALLAGIARGVFVVLKGALGIPSIPGGTA
jgi:hypothetical protein